MILNHVRLPITSTSHKNNQYSGRDLNPQLLKPHLLRMLCLPFHHLNIFQRTIWLIPWALNPDPASQSRMSCQLDEESIKQKSWTLLESSFFISLKTYLQPTRNPDPIFGSCNCCWSNRFFIFLNSYLFYYNANLQQKVSKNKKYFNIYQKKNWTT